MSKTDCHVAATTGSLLCNVSCMSAKQSLSQPNLQLTLHPGMSVLPIKPQRYSHPNLFTLGCSLQGCLLLRPRAPDCPQAKCHAHRLCCPPQHHQGQSSAGIQLTPAGKCTIMLLGHWVRYKLRMDTKCVTLGSKCSRQTSSAVTDTICL